MRKQCVPGSFLSAHALEPGNEAGVSPTLFYSELNIKDQRHQQLHAAIYLLQWPCHECFAGLTLVTTRSIYYKLHKII